MNRTEPLLSIICPTYNQEKFIAQTLDGFVMQKTEYPFEIIVHDDASTDNTPNISREYELKFPDFFKNIYQIENQFSKAIMSVTKITFSAARGKYLVLCEGDDYWTDPYKIQKQISFLETHPEYVGCFHNTEERYVDDESKASFLYCGFSSARPVTFSNLAYSNLMPTCSVVFRRGLFGNFPDWYDTLKMGDWPLHLLNAQFGNFWYMPQIMAVHRLHSKSIWMLQDTDLNKQHTIEAYDAMIVGFGKSPEFLLQLKAAREYFINPPIKRPPNLARRGVNYVKRLITH
jgi:glycosyltransferase involved in cell wall biosynthesis